MLILSHARETPSPTMNWRLNCSRGLLGASVSNRRVKPPDSIPAFASVTPPPVPLMFQLDSTKTVLPLSSILSLEGGSWVSLPPEVAIFVFERAATDQPFFQTAMLTLPDGVPNDGLGRHLDFRFGRIVAGSRGRYLFRGGAYVWERRCLGWRLISFVHGV